MIWHALATYKLADRCQPALVLGSADKPQIFDLENVYRSAHADAKLPDWISGGVCGALHNWPEVLNLLPGLAESTAKAASSGAIAAIDNGLAAVVEPLSLPRIFAAASNYVKHAKEMGTVLTDKADSNPYMFIKASTSVIGPGQTVYIPPETQKPDWEVELAAVVGRSARRVGEDEALDYVAGYTIINDVSARDLTRREDFPFKFDWFQGKSFDTFAPLGPWIVPSALIGDPQTVKLGLSVNGEMMQDGTTAEMIFSVREQISYLSSLLTLRPGDVIATGTPTGVGASRGMFLQPGDVMRATIENIGALENPVEAEVVA